MIKINKELLQKFKNLVDEIEVEKDKDEMYEIKEIQSKNKKYLIDKEIPEWGRVIISYIPEVDLYELDLDNYPLEYFKTLKSAIGDIPIEI